MAQDLPLLDEDITKLPSDMVESLADLGRTNLYFLNKAILGYRDMTEECHGPLCEFFTSNPKQFLMGLMPRDHFKTSVITVGGNTQKAIKDPNERILIGNETSTNAERMLGAIRQHFESNRILRALYSDVIPKDTRKTTWNNQSLQLNRDWIGPEPTFDTIGMTGAATSRHYTHICYDDPISEEAVSSEKVMNDTISRMGALTALLVKPKTNTVWLIGTRWALWDVYSWFRQTYHERLGILARSAVEDGKIIFPHLLDPEILAIKRRAMGEYKFSCIMMNNPRNSEIQDLNIEDVRWFRWADDGEKVVLTNAEGAPIDVWRLDQLDITVTIDPAPAETTKSDRNAVITCGISPRNQVIVLDAWADRCTPYTVIEKLFQLHDRFHPRVYGVEGVAYQKVFKYIIQREAERSGRWLRVEELRAPGKHKVHVRGIQPVMRLHRLFCHPSQLMLTQEMADFPLGEHDDNVDALGLQQQLWRGRMSEEHLAKVEAEAANMARRITGYSIRNDPGPDPDILRALREELADEEIEPEVDWDEVPITRVA